MVARHLAAVGLGLCLGASGCGGGGDLPNGLLLAISRFEKGAGGAPKPHSELVFLSRQGGKWLAETHEDPSAPVFHKALLYQPPGGELGILTLGGSAPGGPAALKLWHRKAGGFERETVWEANFGGKFSRMRDAELADLDGDGELELAVATHDQGVVAVVQPEAGGGYAVTQLDQEANTFVHEIEVGDVDGDGALEIYATPSEPNRLDGTPQPGKVVRYVPKLGQGRTLVADLGQRHAKEILVGDVDGDGRDELYVSIEGEVGEGGKQLISPVEIRRYDAGTPAGAGALIATLDDRLCRFLTAGDLDGDGKRELIAATFSSGVWLLRPGADPKAKWQPELVDADSAGFEHAAVIADLDADGVSELYVASDQHKELRRYVWQGGKLVREVIYRRPDARPIFTWNLMPIPVGLMPEGS
jgi:hypothetical protein